MKTLVGGLLLLSVAAFAGGQAARPGPVPTQPASAPQPETGTGGDLYDFQHARRFPAQLEIAGDTASFAWPDAIGPWDTALLQVDVQPAGDEGDQQRWIDMSVAVPCHWAPPLDYGRRLEPDPGPEAPGFTSGCARQFLEPGAQGVRYLNLSFLQAAGVHPGQRVQLARHDVGLTAAAALWIFHTRLPVRGRVLVLAPHPDDAEIAAFGLYAQENAWVVTVTAGDAGGFAYPAEFSRPDYAFKGRLRVIDSVTVPLQGGVPPAHCFNLGYFDARVDAMYAHPDVAVAEKYVANHDIFPFRRINPGRLLPVQHRDATWDHLVADLQAVLLRVQPEIIIAPHPFLDAHLDHEFVAVALAEALRRVHMAHAPELLLYTNHALRDERYPYGPTATVAGLPPSRRPNVPFGGVYSLPLDSAMQTRKLFALESMHDLRAEPAAEYAFPSPSGAIRHLASAPPPTVDTGYFRRAVHANEIYLTYDVPLFELLTTRFLATLPGRGPT